MSQSHREDAHRIEFLRKAVIWYNWSNEPLYRVPTLNVSFQQSYGELDASLQLHRKVRLESERDNVSLQPEMRKQKPFGVQSVGQGRFRNTSSSSQAKVVEF